MKTVIVEILESDLDKVERFILIEDQPAIVEFVNNHLLPFEVDDVHSLKKLIAACKNLVEIDGFYCVSYDVETDYVDMDHDDYGKEDYTSIGRVAFDDKGLFVINKSDLLAAIDNYEF